MRDLFNILFNHLLNKSTFTSSLSSDTAPESLTRGIYDNEDDWHVLLPHERNSHSHKDLVTLVEVKVWARVEDSTSILPGQDDNLMVKDVKIEVLSEVSPKVRLDEVVSLAKEIPGMEELDASQLGKLVGLVFGAESVVDGCCHEDGGCANRTSDELVVLAGNGGQVGRAESGHGEVRKGERKRHEVLLMFSGVERMYVLSTQ